MPDAAPLDTIYTADEAAERMRLHKRGLIKIAKKHGYCSRVGRDYLFSEADLLAIWQAMREPPAETRSVASAASLRPSRSPHSILEELKWMGTKPPTKADRRVLEILRWLDRQTEAKNHKQIERAGARTIDSMLSEGFVTKCGIDGEGLVRIRIAPLGRDQIRIVERWERKRAARGHRAGLR